MYDLKPGEEKTVTITVLPSSMKDSPGGSCNKCTTYTVKLKRMTAEEMSKYYSLAPSTQRSTSMYKASSTDEVGYTIVLDTEAFMTDSNTGL